jgi:hypothetical protein
VPAETIRRGHREYNAANPATMMSAMTNAMITRAEEVDVRRA